jgi:hypothetical protein
VGQLFQKISEVIGKPLVSLKGVRPENNGKLREKIYISEIFNTL